MIRFIGFLIKAIKFLIERFGDIIVLWVTLKRFVTNVLEYVFSNFSYFFPLYLMGPLFLLLIVALLFKIFGREG